MGREMDCCGLEAAGRLAIMVSGILPMETVLGGWLVCVCVGYYVSKRVCVCVAYFRDNTVSS